jgi:hypothetical protein
LAHLIKVNRKVMGKVMGSDGEKEVAITVGFEY